MTPPVCIFTYALDSPVLIECVGALHECGLNDVWVFEEWDKPIPYEAKELIDATFISTDFSRGGNLNGCEAISGMASCYLQALKETGHSHLIKIDPDIILLRPERLLKAIAENVTHAAACCPQRMGYGCLQVISRRLAESLVNPDPGLPMAEDLHNKARSLILPGEARGWPIEREGGFIYAYGYKDVPLSVFAERFDAVNFGNWSSCPGLLPCEKRENAAVAMSKLRSIKRST